MTTIELKSNFHKLIDEINDDALLNQFYDILSTSKDSKKESLWTKLTESQQKDLIKTEEESYNEDLLIPHNEILNKNQKWL